MAKRSLLNSLWWKFSRTNVYKLFGKNLTIGREHPQQAVTSFFMKELADCLNNGAIVRHEIDQAIEKNFIRKDIYLELEKHQTV